MDSFSTRSGKVTKTNAVFFFNISLQLFANDQLDALFYIFIYYIFILLIHHLV
jgi:hypothetical protein